jgi:regulator of sigma D
MGDTFDTSLSLLDKVSNDPLTITEAELKTFSNTFIDASFKLGKSCHFKRVYDSVNDWCLNNLEVCIGNDSNMSQRLLSNAPQLIMSFFDLSKNILTIDNGCYSHQRFISNVGDTIKDLSAIASTIAGFEGEFPK